MRVMCKYLIQYRKANQLTQAQLAARLGASQSMVTHVEKGRRRLSYDTAVRWSAVLGCDPELLRESPYEVRS